MITVKNDRLLSIATGESRKSHNWDNDLVAWSDLLNICSITKRTGETLEQFCLMSKDEQTDIKDVGGFVGGYLPDGLRKKDEGITRSLITLDADFATPDFWEEVKEFFPAAICCYSTHKHTPEQPRLRLLIPLNRDVTPEEYEAIARMIAKIIGIDSFDDSTYEVNRLMFWPSTASDGEYLFDYLDLPLLDADRMLGSYANWRDCSLWPRSSRSVELHIASPKRQEDPLTKGGCVGLFCRTYSITETLERFLVDVYEPGSEGRYTYKKGTTANGLVVYSDKWAYSHHGTDPAGGLLCNAFDLFRIHKFGHLDTPDKPNESFLALAKWVDSDHACATRKLQESFGESQADDEVAEVSDEAKTPASDAKAANAQAEVDAAVEWMKQISFNRNGKPEPSRANLELIFTNDPNLKGLFGYDELAYNITFTGNTKWRAYQHSREPYWKDTDRNQLRCYIDSIYRISDLSNDVDVLTNVALKRKFHPVREYLEGLRWDGTARAESLFIDYLGAEDTPYVRAVTRKFLLAAVRRIFTPGVKVDTMLVLISGQGTGKSSLVRALARSQRAYANISSRIDNKDFRENIRGKWIVEIDELSALRSSTVEALKSAISTQYDTYRPAYGHVSQDFPRQCVFVGTTNSVTFLKDDTGNRRFWPVEVGIQTPKYRVDFNAEEFLDIIDHVWAEVMHMDRTANERHYFDEQEAVELGVTEAQEERAEADPWAGIIGAFLERKIRSDWYDLPVSERAILMANYSTSPDMTEERVRICTKEVWVEALGRQLVDMQKYDGDRIAQILVYKFGWIRASSTHRFGAQYGTQKYYYQGRKAGG